MEERLSLLLRDQRGSNPTDTIINLVRNKDWNECLLSDRTHFSGTQFVELEELSPTHFDLLNELN